MIPPAPASWHEDCPIPPGKEVRAWTTLGDVRMTAVWERDDVGGVQLAATEGRIPSPGELLGESQIFLDALASARKLVRRRAPFILLQGEPGTGRTLLARSIHYEGASHSEPFIAVQCASVPPSLLEAELFGVEDEGTPASKGGRPGILKLAGVGTVFLDEVHDLPEIVRLRLASYLLGNAGEEHLNCWIVGASRTKPDPNPDDDRRQQDFQRFLYQSMVEVPPLRSRERDIELLSRHFLREWAMEHSAPVPVLESRAIDAVYAYPWPGNVRELRDVLERAATLAPGRRIGPEHLRIKTRQNAPLGTDEPASRDMILIPPEGKTLEQIEAEAVRATLKLTGGNRSAAARILEISRPTLSRKIKKYL